MINVNRISGNRREFLSACASALAAARSLSATPLPSRTTLAPPQREFLYGASVYPELQTRDEWNRMLDEFRRAHMNLVRVAESSWGNLEIAPGKFNFGWLHTFLDDLHRREMKAILGTSTYVPPQWLVGAHPEITVQLLPGMSSDPMVRKSPCLNDPQYRAACRRYISAIGNEFKNHPAVIGWQLDNEIEFLVSVICYNPACDRAWRQWLETTYRTPDEFNRRLDLVSWGMKISSFDDVPQPRPGVEGSGQIRLAGSKEARQALPAVSLANFHFERDTILNFLAEQAGLLRGLGVTQWILTDWNDVWPAVADDPKARAFMSIAGLNYYQPSADNAAYWRGLAWQQDMHRSAYGVGQFITTETRFGVAGGTQMADPAPPREQFLMWGLQAAAFGSSALMFWSGNRWRGGNWPHWGGLLDWSGHPEVDFAWAVELGALYNKWSSKLLENPVRATAAVLTDFNQRTALEVYPHVPDSSSVLPESFDAFHRLGIGADSINTACARDASILGKYSCIALAAAAAFDNPQATASLRAWIEGGGVLIVTPFTSYMSEDGVFRGDGFAANLKGLTGVLVRTVRWMGSPSTSGRADQRVRWNQPILAETSLVGLNGYVEYLELEPGAEVVATFESDQEILHGKPAAARNRIGKGTVIKLGFWPKDDGFVNLLQTVLPSAGIRARKPMPPGVLAVPRTDGSLFIVNTASKEHVIELEKAGMDRLSGKQIDGQVSLRPYEVLWAE
jgi:beta-galactosidase